MFNYSLPTIEMIAGDTCPFEFHVQSSSRLNITSGTCSAYFSISEYINSGNNPIVTATQSNIRNGNLVFDVSPAQTVNLHGKYVYQLMLSNGTQSEIYGGHLVIYANRNKSAILN